jgi:hypothetical protein
MEGPFMKQALPIQEPAIISYEQLEIGVDTAFTDGSLQPSSRKLKTGFARVPVRRILKKLLVA